MTWNNRNPTLSPKSEQRTFYTTFCKMSNTKVSKIICKKNYLKEMLVRSEVKDILIEEQIAKRKTEDKNLAKAAIRRKKESHEWMEVSEWVKFIVKTISFTFLKKLYMYIS